jgi:hypothetical protein
MRIARRAALCAGALAAGGVALIAVVGGVAVASLRPQPGEWAVALPLGQTLRLSVGVPSLIRLATQPPVARWLADREWRAGGNRLRLHWDEAGKRLSVDCAPCTLAHAALGSEPLTLTRLGGDVHRHGEALQGHWWLGEPAQEIRVAWQGELSQGGLNLRTQAQRQSLARLYAALAPSVPEAARARISGEWGVQATLRFPNGHHEVIPEMDGLTVSRLGTQALLGLPTADLPPDHALARAVIAAEDQRFEQHTGFDPEEWQQVLRHGVDTLPRGASTLTQQLAKLLCTGDERSARRKLRELLYAADMEGSLGKARILQLYLAQAPWGEGVRGAEAAAMHYFGRPAARLTTAQAVWLASMLNQPDTHARRWRQRGHVDLRRANWVAQQMRVRGRGLPARQLRAVQAELPRLKSQAWLDGVMARSDQ